MSETITTEPPETRNRKPLWTDDGRKYHYSCWNCGKLAHLMMLSGYSSRFVCECGCGWSNRVGFNRSEETRLKRNQEVALVRVIGIPLVDFTQPGALSSPA